MKNSYRHKADSCFLYWRRAKVPDLQDTYPFCASKQVVEIPDFFKYD